MKIVLAALAVVIVLASSGCGSSSPSATSGAADADAPDVAATGESLDGSPATHADAASSDGGGKPSGDAGTDVAPSDAPVDAPQPADLATTDGKVPAGWYCGSNAALMSHVVTWNAPTLKNAGNLFHVASGSDVVTIEGYCDLGCVTSTDGHDHCTAPAGAPVASKECFDGAGKYCGHTLGIEARSYPVVAGQDKEGLFDCSGQTDVLLDANCACAVTPGAADECVTPPGRRLWIAYETGTTTCVSQLTDFWDCLLSHSSFDDLVLSYGTGYTLGWGGIAQVPSSCGIDYGCATSTGKWSVGPLDVVMIVTAGGVGGQNDWTPTVTVNGKTVPIHGAHIGDASGDCGMQTAYSMHEVYEATTDPGAADCCDGEIPAAPAGESGCLAWNTGCSPACARWGPGSCGGDGSYGLATLQCPHGAYTYQRVSPATDEYGFGANQCLTITVH
jgi:hypothetical protein